MSLGFTDLFSVLPLILNLEKAQPQDFSNSQNNLFPYLISWKREMVKARIYKSDIILEKHYAFQESK